MGVTAPSPLLPWLAQPHLGKDEQAKGFSVAPEVPNSFLGPPDVFVVVVVVASLYSLVVGHLKERRLPERQRDVEQLLH